MVHICEPARCTGLSEHSPTRIEGRRRSNLAAVSTWILEGEIAIVLFGALLPLVLLPLVYVHYRRHGRFAGWPAAVTMATFLYGCGLVAFTFFPLPEANDQFCSLREEISFWQLTPFSSLGDVIDEVAAVGLASTLTSSVFLQVAFNVLLLVPLGILLAYRYRRRLGFTVAIGLGVSLAIELTQGTGIWGTYGCPYRLADVDDLVTNTTGAAVGWFIGAALTRVLPDSDPPPVPDIDLPRIRRRVAAGILDGVAFVVTSIFVQVIVIAAVEAFAGEGFSDRSWFTSLLVGLGTIPVGIGLFLVVPFVRRDSATPGQVAVWCAESPVAGGPKRLRGVAARFGVRWLPILAAAYWQPALVLVAVAVVEAVTVMVRPDRRSLSAVAGGTTTITRRALALSTETASAYRFPGK